MGRWHQNSRNKTRKAGKKSIDTNIGNKDWVILIFEYVRAGINIDHKGLVLSLILSVAYIYLYIDKYCLTRAEIEVGNLTPELS